MNIKIVRKIMLVFCVITVAGIIFSCNNKNYNTKIIIENSESSVLETINELDNDFEKESPVIIEESETLIFAEDCININTANLEELKSLPGIGDAKANAIITYRENISVFYKIEDIMNVPGIKEGAYKRIKDHIKV